MIITVFGNRKCGEWKPLHVGGSSTNSTIIHLVSISFWLALFTDLNDILVAGEAIFFFVGKESDVIRARFQILKNIPLWLQ